jgi:ubiquinone/menaquinone biosynthesis C-methylase UbiE
MSEHTSLSEDSFPSDGWADVVTASANYATRFAGPVGQFFLSTQTHALLSFLPAGESLSILDVGGGHGQAAGPLLSAGHKVTIQGSDPACRARIEDLLALPEASFVESSPIDLPFPDKSFDWVVCLRLLTHCPDPAGLIKELTRVARKGVIIDYPNTQSVNAIGPLFFRWKRKLEKNTRQWSQFSHAEVRFHFESAGFKAAHKFNQFFFPMALHRLHRSAGFAKGLEGFARVLGLSALLGNPTLLQAKRHD